jgi:cell surface protein SprA
LACRAALLLLQFNIKADEYEENRHFLLAQYFRQNYNKAMSPAAYSINVQVLRVEVWVTNRTGATTDTRDVVAFMDLGEEPAVPERSLPAYPGHFPIMGKRLYRTV